MQGGDKRCYKGLGRLKKVKEGSRRFKKVQEGRRRFKKVPEDSNRLKKVTCIYALRKFPGSWLIEILANCNLIGPDVLEGISTGSGMSCYTVL